MLEGEARWIAARLESQPTHAISPLLNLGSGTLRFRTQVQPWIDGHVFAPLRARGVSVVHCDIAVDPGVDLVADLLAADGPARLAAFAPRAIVCSNVLEHVQEPGALARRYLALLPPGGLAIVTTPLAYPFHPDPIDTLFRPSLRELEALHPGTVLLASGTVTAGSFRAEVRARPSRLLAELAALPGHLSSGRGARASPPREPVGEVLGELLRARARELTRLSPSASLEYARRVTAPLAEHETFRFDRLEDLARLPWFDLDGDRLVVSDRTVGPVIDMHAHYALPTLWPLRIDLGRASDRTELLLPCCSRHDLDVYANHNFGALGVKRLKRELVLGGATGLGKRKTHTAPNHARDCRDLGIVHSAILAVDVGIPSHHVADSISTAKALASTTPFGSVHPRRRRPKEKLEEQLHAGARGLKLHPQLQKFLPGAPEAMPLYALAAAERIPVLWHCGPVGIELASARKFVQVPSYERPLAECPGTTFVLGHSGALACEQGIALQRRHANAWLEVSCISLSQLRQVIAEADPDRIVYGTDWPFYHHALALAKVLVATEGRPDLRRKILHDNAARLLGL